MAPSLRKTSNTSTPPPVSYTHLYALWLFGALTLTLTPLLQGQTKQPLDLETVTYGGKTFRSLFYPQPVYGLAWLQSGYTYTVEPGDYGREGLSLIHISAPKPEDQDRLESDPGSVRADAYDMVINGVEVGGGSIRIHDAELQARVFAALGFTKERAEEQFGFLMNAFKYGAPPHGGIAFGLDRWVSLMAELDSIRDCIAFPKNNSGRDVMIDAPARLDPCLLYTSRCV